MALTPGTVLGPYLLDRLVGRGATGTVWCGLHGRSAERVAIKLVSHAGARHAAAFRNEVRAAAALQHPGIVAVHDVGNVPDELGGGSFVAMELADTSLARRVPAEWDAARAVLLQVLAGLGAAHARGIVHRDVKPDNVLCFAGGRVALTDFGASEMPDATIGERRRRIGTPGWWAPEQAGGRWREVGPWSDLFAVGRIAEELPISSAPPGLRAWIEGLMDPRPEGRFRFAADAAHALLALGPELAPWSPRPAAPSASSSTLDDVALDGAGAAPDSRRAPLPRAPLPPRWPEVEAWPRATTSGLGLLELRDPPFRGRLQERDRLWATLSTTGPAVVRITGPAGVGKTRLAREFAEAAHRAGVRVLEARDDGLGLAGLVIRAHRLVDRRGAELRADLVAAADEDLADGLFGLVERGPGTAGLGALCRWLEALARERPVVVRVEDADRVPGVLALAKRLPALEGSIVLVLTADLERLAEAPDGAHPLAGLGGDRLEVGPLDVEDLRAALDGLVPLEPDTLAKVTARAAGNALAGVMLLRDLVRSGALVPTPAGFGLADGASLGTLPDDVRASWARRLAPFLDEAGHPLAVAALLGAPVALPEWVAVCRAAGLAPSEDLWERLVGAGIARACTGGFEYVHPAVGEVVVEHVGTRRAALHSAIADVVGTRARRAIHLLEAGRVREALPALVARVWKCDDTGAMAIEIERLARAVGALGAQPPAPERHELALAKAFLARRRARHAEAEAFARGVLADPEADGERHLRALVELARVVQADGRHVEAIAALEQALPRVDDPRRRHLVRMYLAGARVAAGELEAATAVCDDVLAEDPADDVRGGFLAVLALARLAAGDVAGAEDAARERLALADRRAEHGSRGDALKLLALAAAAAGRPAEADARWAEARQAFRRAGTDPLLCDVERAEALVASRRFVEAGVLLSAMVQPATRRSPTLVRRLRTLRALAMAGAGAWDEVDLEDVEPAGDAAQWLEEVATRAERAGRDALAARVHELLRLGRPATNERREPSG